ncbi:hypothetical protein [Pedobacter namyangjuensis]|uniref:hypothetical protein n=1 Tax=Pedobacter namyangjuensis TaxID=600626 RepID=UPI001962DADF|nr:hypothetical protein [Pedobacter namyangjuensis]
MVSCSDKISYSKKKIYQDKFEDAVPVLDVATFHMGETSDASSTAFDEKDSKNLKDIRDLANRLATFRPAVIPSCRTRVACATAKDVSS